MNRKSFLTILFVVVFSVTNAATIIGPSDTIHFDTTAGTYSINGGNNVNGSISGTVATYTFAMSIRSSLMSRPAAVPTRMVWLLSRSWMIAAARLSVQQ